MFIFLVYKTYFFKIEKENGYLGRSTAVAATPRYLHTNNEETNKHQHPDLEIIDDSPPPSTIRKTTTTRQQELKTAGTEYRISKQPMSPLSLNRSTEQKFILVKKRRNVPTATVATQTDPSYFY